MNAPKLTGPGHILLADDDEAFRRTAARFLSRHGFECVEAVDAGAAANALRELNFDLLIADIYMSGNAELEMIRQVPQIADGLPIILMTGRPTVETAVQSIRLGVVGYLTKPPNFEELLTITRQAIANYRTYSMVNINHQRLRAWCQDLDRIKAVMRNSMAADKVASWQTFLTASLNNVIDSLVDLKVFSEVVAQHQETVSSRCLLHTSSPGILIEALRETITTLEKSKSTFKSKKLGDLRKRLERLLT